MIPDDAAASDDLLSQTARLEAALERIAAASAREPAAARDAVSAEIDTAALATRLDSVIARLRAAVGEA
jgi:hypothetical protein